MDKKEQILDLYFNKHLKQKEISELVNATQQYISKIIKTDERYEKEKASRKTTNAEKRKIAQAEYQKNYIRKNYNKLEYEQLLAVLTQDAIELSYDAHPLSNYACKKANSSIYRFNKKKNQYVMKKDINASIDLPRRISMNTY